MPPADELDPKASPQKKWGCLKRIALILLIATPIALLLLNGPIFCFAADKALSSFAEKNGLTHQATIKGSLWSGPSITGVNLSPSLTGTASGVVKSLEIGEASIDYSIPTLISDGPFSMLKKLALKRVSLELELPSTSEKEPSPESEPDETKEPFDFTQLWGLLGADFEIEDVTVVIRQGE